MVSFGTQGELEKMLIRAFTDARCETPAPDLDLRLMLNPETLSLNYGIRLAPQLVPGNSASNPAYDGHEPRNLNFEFLFDRTGAIPGAAPDARGIQAELDKLKTLVGFNSATHQPYYLIINWASFVMRCKLTSLQVTYKLFRPDGTPLRATANCGFEEFMEEELRVAEENRQSPDVTHARTVPEGEHLPYQTFKIYGDSKHYLEVARANGLVNFRRLETGSTLLFPPLEK